LTVFVIKAVIYEENYAMKRNGPRRRSLSHSERIIRAIAMARKRFSDDMKFLQEVNNILLRERILTKEEFGMYDKPTREDEDSIDENL